MHVMPIVFSLHVFFYADDSMLFFTICSCIGIQSILHICVSFRLRCNVMFNAKESICIALLIEETLQSKLISRMMMDNISLAWTQKFSRKVLFKLIV